MKIQIHIYLLILCWTSFTYADLGPVFEVRGLSYNGGSPGIIYVWVENIGDTPLPNDGIVKWSVDSGGQSQLSAIIPGTLAGFLGTAVVSSLDPGIHTFYVHTYTHYNNTSPHYTSSVDFSVEPPTTNEIKSTAVLLENILDIYQIDPLNVYQKMEMRTYYNALGRNIQTIDVAASPDEKDIVSPVEYDALGLQSKAHLSYVLTSTGNDGEYQETALDDQASFYQSPPSPGIAATDYPFAETDYEKSPLLRTLEQSSIGQSWRLDGGATIDVAYSANVANTVRKLSYDAQNDVISSSNTYDAGELYLTITTDENEHDAYEYTNKSDKTILKKTTNDEENLLTYYIYDEFDNLRVILPPMAVAEITNWGSATQVQNAVDKWGTVFKYDGYQRIVEKKIPEADAIYTVYDRLGRAVLTQDGNLRDNDQWFFTKYDVHGRAILTGLYKETSAALDTREEMQNHLDNNITTYYETPVTGGTHGYSNTAFPNTAQCEIWTVTYYDDYDFNNNGSPDFTYIADAEYDPAGEKDFYRLQGKVTGTKTLELGSGSSSVEVIEADVAYNALPSDSEELYLIGTITLGAGFRTNSGQKVRIGPNVTAPNPVSNNPVYRTAVSFYDKYGRVIQTQSENHLGGTDVSHSEYDFAGKLLKSKLLHQTTAASVTVRNRFEYDHAGRVLEVWQKNDNDTEVLLAENHYNELGQLITQKLHSPDNAGNGFLQTVNFTYNERGWLTKINNPASLGSDLFAMQLYYNEGHSELNAPAQYNGNISAMEWRVNTNLRHGYGYQYDDINQLIDAEYGDAVGGTWNTGEAYSVNNLSYDLNGNIQTLNRQGSGAGYVDQLTYTYDSNTGNRLKRVDDAVNGHWNYDFNDLVEQSDEYEYDANGNMTGDLNKGISVTYNELNLPTKVDFGSGDKIEWIYSATGAKLRKTVYSNHDVSERTDYSGSFVYKNNALAFFHTQGGRVVKNGANYEYQYAIKDHLGNTRVMFGDADDNGSPEVVQETHYYPFGLTLAGLGSSGGAPENKFLYNGKELEDEHNLYWYHYGARYYDPQLGRWHSIDPADEFYSPYIYVANNPIILLDPDGEDAEIANLYIPRIFTTGWRPSEFARSYPFANASWDYIIGSFPSAWSLDIQGLESKLNKYAEIWSNSESGYFAPKVAEHLKNNTIKVAVVSGEFKVMVGLPRADKAPVYTRSVNGVHVAENAIAIFLDQFVTGGNDLGSTFLHELVHNIGYGEFGAFAAEVAAGYITFHELLEGYTRDGKYWTTGWEAAAERFGYYWQNGVVGKIRPEDRSAFEAEFIKYGKEIIGK